MSCPSPLQGLCQIGLSAKQRWFSVNYLLPEEGLGLALAVGLDAANVVGRGAVQNLQKLLQGGLQRGESRSGRGWSCLGASAGPWLETASDTSSPKTRIFMCPGMAIGGSYCVQAHPSLDVPLLLQGPFLNCDPPTGWSLHLVSGFPTPHNLPRREQSQNPQPFIQEIAVIKPKPVLCAGN